MRVLPPPGQVSDTREKILGLADEFIRRRGYNAFSYKDIGDSLGVKPAAVHYHFPSKEALGAAVLEREISAFRHNGEEWKQLSPEVRLRKLFTLFAGYQQRSLVCLMGSLCPDYDTLPPTMQTQISTYSAAILDWVTDVLEEGRRLGRLHFEGAPADRALLTLSALMSSLLLSRVKGEEAFDRITKQLLNDLKIC
jgi:AcrR family transcriptional regulator